MHPTIAAALPKLAAQIDTERPLIARAIADYVTVEINAATEEVTLHVSDEASYDLLTTISQRTYLRQAFDDHHFLAYTLRIERPRPTAPKPAAEPPASPTPPRCILDLRQRAALLTWLEARPNLCATLTDNQLAADATAELGFPIGTTNIRTIRVHELGIAKAKAEPPAPPSDISLAVLQAAVDRHSLQLDAIQGINLAEVLTNLRDSLHALDLRVKALETLND
jgi:hypothetical protein